MFHLPDSMSYTNEQVQMFWPNQVTGATTDWQIWRKPLGMTGLFIMAIGGGGGGAGGNHTSDKGGGGGGSSGISRYLYPAWAIPDELLIQVGAGGVGGVGGATTGPGGNGALSYVSLYPNTAANNLFAVSGAAAAQGANGDLNGTGGVAGTIATDAGAVFSCWAMTKYIAGMAGATSPNVAGNITVGTACMILGGAGGCDNTVNRAGGVTSAVSNTPFIQAGSGATGIVGGDGFRFGQFPIFYGGGGGGTDGSNVAHAGGGAAASPGAGGGGGSNGATASAAGGPGGPGLVLMVAW